MSSASVSECPFQHVPGGGTSNKDWWPTHLPLELLQQQ